MALLDQKTTESNIRRLVNEALNGQDNALSGEIVPKAYEAALQRIKNNATLKGEVLTPEQLQNRAKAFVSEDLTKKLQGALGTGELSGKDKEEMLGIGMKLFNTDIVGLVTGFFTGDTPLWQTIKESFEKRDFSIDGFRERLNTNTRMREVSNFAKANSLDLAALTSQLAQKDPVVPEVKSIVVAAAPAPQKTPEQLAAEQLAAQERARAAKQAKDGKPVAKHSSPAGEVKPGAPSVAPQGKAISTQVAAAGGASVR